MPSDTNSCISGLGDPWKRAWISAVVVLLITSVHHAYGAYIYETPFRLHILAVAVPLAILLPILLTFGSRQRATTLGRFATICATGLIFLVPVALIGLFEGFYSHLIKDTLYFGGASEQLMRRLFPPPTYEMPNDWLFEVTGLLQFVACLFAARDGYAALRQALISVYARNSNS